MGDSFVLINDEQASDVLLKMYKQFRSNKFIDIVLASGIDSHTVSAHRLVLVASSNYFCDMFAQPASNNNDLVIVLDAMEGVVIERLVKYMYTGKLEVNVSSAKSFMRAAKHFQLHNVVEKCYELIVRNLNSSNCLDYWNFAEEHNFLGLLEKAKCSALENFMEIFKMPKFCDLSPSQLRTLYESDDLNVATEEDVYKSLMLWHKHAPAARKNSMIDLMSLLRVNQLRSEFVVENLESLNRSKICALAVKKVLEHNARPNRRGAPAGAKPRKSMAGTVLAVRSFGNPRRQIVIEKYEPYADKWTICKNINDKRIDFGAAIIGFELIIIGGESDAQTLRTVRSYNFNADSYTALSSMKTCRTEVTVVMLDKFVYAIGGRDNGQPLESVERWDNTLDVWQMIPPMSIKRAKAAAATLYGKLYVIGGHTILDVFECYDPKTNKWTVCANRIKKSDKNSLVALNGYLYSIGSNLNPMCERYDPVNNRWQPFCNLYERQFDISCVAFRGGIIAAGGKNEKLQTVSTVQAYDSDKNAWSKMENLNHKGTVICLRAYEDL